jgi:hypothetical protein
MILGVLLLAMGSVLIYYTWHFHSGPGRPQIGGSGNTGSGSATGGQVAPRAAAAA